MSEVATWAHLARCAPVPTRGRVSHGSKAWKRSPSMALCELIGFGWTQQAKKVCVILNVTSTEQLADDLNNWAAACGGKVDYCRVKVDSDQESGRRRSTRDATLMIKERSAGPLQPQWTMALPIGTECDRCLELVSSRLCEIVCSHQHC